MRKRLAVGLVAAAVVIGLVIAARHDLVRFALGRVAAAACGCSIRLAGLHLGNGALTLSGVHIRRNGLPLLDAGRIVVRYSPGDLLPSSTHRYGLLAIEADDATITIARLRDGSYNLALPRSQARAPAAPHPTNPVPLRFTARVRGGQIVLSEPYGYDPSAKEVRIRNVNADAIVDTAAVTHYRVTGAFRERRTEPFAIAGTIDAVRGYAMHHARAARFPLRALANFFADTPTVRILKGRARNFDARVYSLNIVPDGTPSYHVSMRFDTEGGSLALSSLAEPLDDIHGRLQLVDNCFFLQDVAATLSGVPIRLTGGIYDLTGALTGAAQLRLAIYGSGELTRLRTAFTFTRDQPIAGRVRLGVLAEGPVDDPLIVARASAPHLSYRGVPLRELQTSVVYHGDRVALAPLRVTYAGIEIGVRGTLSTDSPVRSLLAFHIAGSASRLPYLDEMLGDEPLLIDGAAHGSDLLFHAQAAASSARGVSRVAALIDMDPNGTAGVEPFWSHTRRGDFDGGYRLDRPHGTSAFWVQASGLRMRAPSYKAFPGIVLPVMPPVDARSVSISIAGGGSGRDVVLAGMVNGDDTTIAGVKFDRIGAAFGGTLADAAVNLLHASGPWGRFDGQGAFSSQALYAYGAYRGRFEGLRPFMGNALAGTGPISGKVAIAVEPQRIVVQGSHLSMPGASLHGIPLHRASITLAVDGDRLRIYSAHAQAAGGDVVAAGSYSLANPSAGPRGEALALVAKDLDAAHLRGIGLPLDGGRLWASGDLAAGAPLPLFAGGVTIAHGRVGTFAVSGGGDVRLNGASAGLQRVIGAVGGTYGLLGGRIGVLTSRAPRYALTAEVPAGSIGDALHAFGYPNRYAAEGSFNARLRIGGRGLAPRVSGRVGLPAGSVNGLPFVDASASVAASTAGASVHHGRVLVGTTYAHFTAVAQAREQAVHVSAERADLSDFNNFFDTGDTLDGDGSIRVAAAFRGARVTSSGDIDIARLRYRNLPIGDTRAVWSSARNVVNGSLTIGGTEGKLRARGSIALTPQRALQATLMRSRFDLDATVDDLDLSLWMPALGFQSVPITGRASGTMALRGRYPTIDMHGSAHVTGGTLGPLALESAQLALHSAGGRILIDRAEMKTPELTASASGSVGMQARDPLDVRVHAATSDLAQLVFQFARLRVPVTGSFESSLQVGGTIASPTFLAGFDATAVRMYGIPMTSLFGEARLNGRTLVLSDAGATFTHGEATLAGSLPLQLAPLRLGAPDQPVSFDLEVVDLDPAVFDATLGGNTKLGGLINGHLGLSGSVGDPLVVGHASLAKGSYSSDLERTPITNAAASLSFSRTVASLDRFSASFGSGSAQGSGRVEFPRGVAAGAARIAATVTARGAQLDLPAYGTGTLDGSVRLEKDAGSIATLTGGVTLSNATLPFAAFVKAAQQAPGGGGPPLPLAFDLQATAGKNVRVRGNGYGAGLDIGASGSVKLNGTLAAPALQGTIASTGGTLTYFDRAFRVQEGSVHFSAADGLLPTLHAVATTSVVNPDPDRARNPYGSAQITINVDGPIQGLKIAFSSTPSGYTRDQIIAMIAPFGGFINGIAFSNQSALAVQQPSGVTPLGALSPIPNVALQQRSTGITVGQEAFNILNAQFTAGLLSPFETALGQGLGLSSVNLTLGYYGNVGVTATRLLGKQVSAVYAVTFGLPQIQSFGLQVQPSTYTSATLSFFYQSGPTRLLQLPGTAGGYNSGYLMGQPLLGNSGFSVTVQRYFK